MGKNSNGKSNGYESKSKVMWELAFGDRSEQFDALFQEIPTTQNLRFMSQRLGKADIQSVIIGLDGTLAPAFAQVSEDVRSKLADLINSNIGVVVFSDAPYTARFEELRRGGVVIPRDRKNNASLQSFRAVCDECSLDPSTTSVIGSSVFTDFPNTSENDSSSFPLKILVKPIPPNRELMEPIGGGVPASPSDLVQGFVARKWVEFRYRHHGKIMALEERARYRRALTSYKDALMLIDVVERNKPSIVRG